MIGIDIVSNKRIERALNKYKSKFLEKIFTKSEIEYCLSKKTYIECLSARFAAKEACIKAIYQHCFTRLEMKQIEIIGKRDEGVTVKIHANDIELSSLEILVSISHEKDYSVAVALIT
ncbi:phosphopantetheine-protein transferase [Thermodesulfobium narugense DSM 14796]|uniref:Phosphopantetheine-protein transferase n=1 Tax=Thermodesulfobium narugense DSM 14796 TaxID=747365 RepID=M1E603_9BACT|nr:holo-ACP synthase [Thermodesulfobium narugense]AEE13928.1 phosphopantetheine-protein transferase [Thermodesulfobium narugense DSM 14796]